MEQKLLEKIKYESMLMKMNPQQFISIFPFYLDKLKKEVEKQHSKKEVTKDVEIAQLALYDDSAEYYGYA